MRFELTEEQRAFGDALERLLSGADTAAVARAWADGDHEPGLKLWARLAEQGVTVLATDASPVEVVIAFEALGRYAVPGPWVESAAYLPIALGREVEGVATVAAPPHAPFALDADVADAVYLAGPNGLTEVTPGDRHGSVDRTRHLFEVAASDPAPEDAAFDLSALATAAQLLGLGERVLADTVAYAKQRRQFGREIGSYQAIKHQLADVRIALDFARPLVHGAAVSLAEPVETAPRAVSAAKVMCGDAAYLAARTGLQVHGAIGYTQEFDLSIWITKIRALVTAWGTPTFHRGRILASLTAQTGG
ncbi:acyl-CoA dehydrogenase family protein [Nocardioides bizhenqiangii]|uniref:Acyl-CoA dehydrogenase family protein n=1 Tax=Nocardioides bizhenqiangii TaxID=3095076 RepID=A0ABZ0ZK37_9ACTN|nr:acyl-CoA dehydrogenase family protein [Nocardioides sp. HM61]WQQ24777.1 acyl-CoA dehydrogenase family protein [Nocardioides sp. HM61]